MPKQVLIHIHADGNELGKVYVPTLGIQADPISASASLAKLSVKASWQAWAKDLRAIYETWTTLGPDKFFKWNGADLNAIYSWLRDALRRQGQGIVSTVFGVHDLAQARAFCTTRGIPVEPGTAEGYLAVPAAANRGIRFEFAA